MSIFYKGSHRLSASRPGWRKLTAVAVAAGAVAAVSVTAVQGHHATAVYPAPTASQMAQLRAMTSTAAGRERLVTGLQASFGKVAEVGTGAMPGQVHTVLADGTTGSHFWVIMSYADVARGLIPVAVGACISVAKLPWAVCSVIGSLLAAYHYPGWMENHGIWIAWYWWPWGYHTGGTW